MSECSIVHTYECYLGTLATSDVKCGDTGLIVWVHVAEVPEAHGVDVAMSLFHTGPDIAELHSEHEDKGAPSSRCMLNFGGVDTETS